MVLFCHYYIVTGSASKKIGLSQSPQLQSFVSEDVKTSNYGFPLTSRERLRCPDNLDCPIEINHDKSFLVNLIFWTILTSLIFALVNKKHAHPRH